MAYRNTPKLNMPVRKTENVLSMFGENNFFDNKNWGIHLGIDIKASCGAKVFSAGRGVVVYSKLHPGEFSPDGKINKRNWGGIIIIAHKNPKNGEIFYSLYGHLGKRYIKAGDPVEIGELIGTIGKSMSESNGIWEDEHLHFAIYAGKFDGKVLPGYLSEDMGKEKIETWKDPLEFIKKYNLRSI
jgi:murein DD-endopeptidase MepM/ murein hydrolase activator NlpD